MIVANREYRCLRSRARLFIETFSIDRKTLYDLAARFLARCGCSAGCDHHRPHQQG